MTQNTNDDGLESVNNAVLARYANNGTTITQFKHSQLKAGFNTRQTCSTRSA